MLKRLLCIVVTAILVLSMCFAFAEIEQIDSTFTSAVGADRDTWFESATNRALLTWCVFIDYWQAGHDPNDLLLDDYNTYVAKDDAALYVAAVNKDHQIVLFTYRPGKDGIAVAYSDDTAALNIDAVMAASFSGSNETLIINDKKIMGEVADELMDIFGNS